MGSDRHHSVTVRSRDMTQDTGSFRVIGSDIAASKLACTILDLFPCPKAGTGRGDVR